jgi:uncharacterized membrane protein
MAESAIDRAIPQVASISLIRWHYLWYVAATLALMVAAIVSGNLWFLNFVHVFSGLLWTGADLFMGFVVGPALRMVDVPTRAAVLMRITPRTLFLMPTVSIVTGTTGWFLAVDMGFTQLPWPQFGWVAAALVLVTVMTVQGLGYLLPTNVRVCLELQKQNPDSARIARLTAGYFWAVAAQGVMQIVIVVIMTRFRTGI